eukprot:4690314-Amphidinium_carterae.1
MSFIETDPATGQRSASRPIQFEDIFMRQFQSPQPACIDTSKLQNVLKEFARPNGSLHSVKISVNMAKVASLSSDDSESHSKESRLEVACLVRTTLPP